LLFFKLQTLLKAGHKVPLNSLVSIARPSGELKCNKTKTRKYIVTFAQEFSE
jgi:hypothetical protein